MGKLVVIICKVDVVVDKLLNASEVFATKTNPEVDFMYDDDDDNDDDKSEAVDKTEFAPDDIVIVDILRPMSNAVIDAMEPTNDLNEFEGDATLVVKKSLKFVEENSFDTKELAVYDVDVRLAISEGKVTSELVDISENIFEVVGSNKEVEIGKIAICVVLDAIKSEE